MDMWMRVLRRADVDDLDDPAAAADVWCPFFTTLLLN